MSNKYSATIQSWGERKVVHIKDKPRMVFVSLTVLVTGEGGKTGTEQVDAMIDYGGDKEPNAISVPEMYTVGKGVTLTLEPGKTEKTAGRWFWQLERASRGYTADELKTKYGITV